MNDKTNQWQINGAGIGVCLVVTALVYWIGIHPQFARQVEAEQARRSLQNKEADATQLVNQLTGLKRDLATVEGQLHASPLRLLPTSAINKRIAALAALAEQHHLKINQVQPGTPEPGKHYSTVPIRLSGSGRFTHVVAFMHQLHVEFKDVGVASWSVSGDPADDDDEAEFAFSLAWFASPAGGENLK